MTNVMSDNKGIKPLWPDNSNKRMRPTRDEDISYLFILAIPFVSKCVNVAYISLIHKYIKINHKFMCIAIASYITKSISPAIGLTNNM